VNGQGERPVPERIGKYEIIGVLGQGGMGVVYRGRDSRIGRDVAIKTLTEGFSGDAEMLKRFYQEAGHTGNLRHPNIVTVYDFGDEAGLPYIVMEYLDGEPLDRLIQNREAVHLRMKLDIVAQVCSALAYAHRQGMIHRDVKPANVFVQRDGLVKLLDFGIARAEGHRPMEQTMTRTGTLVGTPAYISPERLRGELFDGRSDIFSAGVMLFQLLTGSLPFDAEYPAILHQILNDDPPPLSSYLESYPPQLDQIVARALAKDPMDRYPIADEMVADLNAVGAQLKAQHIAELLAASRVAVEAQEYVRAQQFLTQILRIDSQHGEAKELIAGIDRHLSLVKVRQRVGQLRRIAEEAIEARNWDQARSACVEALQLDAADAGITSLLDRANTGKQKKEHIQKLLRDAESARQASNYEAARVFAGKALEFDPADSRILAVCKALERESEEARKRAQLRRLLLAVQDDLSASRLGDASRALTEAGSLSSSDPELLRLRDELGAATRQQERKRLVEALQEKAALAITFEQLRDVASEVRAALEQLPAEPTLLRLKMEIDPRLREYENRRLIAEVTAACAQLSPAAAIQRIREALAKLPGNADLLQLESAISQRLAREGRERLLAEYLAKARALLEEHLYIETVRLLEHGEREGLSSPELTELMNLAKTSAAERISQDLIERTFVEAKRLFDEQNYEEVLRLVPPVLERIDEPSLRRLLEEATSRQRALDSRVEQVAAEAQRLCGMELFDAAVGLIRSEPPGVQQSARVQSALALSAAYLESESTKLEAIGSVYAALERPESAAMLQKIAQADPASKLPRHTAEIEQRLGARIRTIAGRHLAKSIEAARQALAAEDTSLAENALQSGAVWQSSADEAAQNEWKAIQAEVAGAKKILRFKRAGRR